MPYLKIIRPFNCFFVALCVLFGALFNSEQANLTAIIASALSAAFIAAGGYVINDYFDLQIDLINKPDRVLPSGKMTSRSAFFYAVSLFALGLIISIFTQNIYCLMIAFLNSLVLYLYASKFKKSCCLGNLLVAYAAASCFIYGGFANANLTNSLVIASFAFLYTLMREFVKDAEDIEGDQKIGARTLAVIAGRRAIIFISLLPALLLIILIQVYFLKQLLSHFSLLALNGLVTMPLIGFFFYLYRKTDKSSFARISSFFKIDMLVLLIIIWIGK